MKDSIIITIATLLWIHVLGTEIQFDVTSDPDVYYLSNYYTSSILANNSIIFNVRGKNDAKISLLSQKETFVSPYYKIIIGGWYNKRSAIRKVNNLVRKHNGRQLNETYAKHFWVSWQNGLVQAGRGSVIDTDVFLSFKDECMFAVNDIGITGSSYNNNYNKTWFFNMTSSTPLPEINSISPYNNINTNQYIKTDNCPSFQRILSSTSSSVIECCGRCGQTLNCYAASYSTIASRCELFTNQALSSTTFTYFVRVE